jgi:hypothetical protein
MKEIIDAVYALWTADATMNDVELPYLSLAGDDNTAFPYATYSVLSIDPQYHFDKTLIEDTTVSFQLVTDSEPNGQTFARKLVDLLAKVKLSTASPVDHMGTWFTGGNEMAFKDAGPSGQTVYQFTRDFRFRTQRELP